LNYIANSKVRDQPLNETAQFSHWDKGFKQFQMILKLETRAFYLGSQNSWNLVISSIIEKKIRDEKRSELDIDAIKFNFA
jgi:hypothetical protein